MYKPPKLAKLQLCPHLSGRKNIIAIRIVIIKKSFCRNCNPVSCLRERRILNSQFSDISDLRTILKRMKMFETSKCLNKDALEYNMASFLCGACSINNRWI